MANNMDSSKEERTLSQTARDAIAELERRAREILQKDMTREPKLEPGEASRIAELEAEIANIGPKMDDMEKQLNANDARLKEVQSLCTLDGFLRGEDLDRLIDEWEHLKHIQPVKAHLLTEGLTMLARSKAEIDKIKQEAREKEAQNGK